MTFEVLVKTAIHIHPAFERVTKILTECIDEGLSHSPDDCVEHLKWILGPSRCGKSQAVDHVLNKYKSLETRDASGRKVIPVLKVTMRSGGSKGGFAMAILEALGADSFARKSATEIFNLAIRQLKLFKVKVLLVDEIQHMTDAARTMSIRGASDVLKELYEGAKISIIFIGLPNAAELYQSNTQLANRSQRRHLFMPYDSCDPMEFREFLISIKGFYEALEIQPYLIPIDFKTFSRALYYLSTGRFGVVCNYMKNLYKLLKRSSDKKVTVEMLYEAATMTAVDFDLVSNIFARNVTDQELLMRWQQIVRAESLEHLVDVKGLI